MVDYNKKDMPQSIATPTAIDKSKVLAQAREILDDSSLTPLECRPILASVARLILSGEELKPPEVAEMLDEIKELFKHESPALRQLVHLIIKEMYQLENLNLHNYRLFLPSSVSKDAGGNQSQSKSSVNNPVRILQPNATRAFCRVSEASTAQSFSTKVDPLIVDPEPSIQSAALVGLYHTLPLGLSHLRPLQGKIQEVPNKIQEAFKEKRGISAWPEYHALGLDYRNRLAPEMLAKDYIRSSDGGSRHLKKLQAPASKIFFARFAAEMAEKSNYRQGAIEFLKEQLDFFQSIEYDPTVTGDKESFVLKRSMVALEAAKTICQIEDIDRGSLDEAVQKLVEMANNSHQVVKFAAMRTLCSVASTYPDMVRRHNDSIRKQMKNSNKDIGSFATTTLLKTADEADVDTLMKEVGSLMTNATNDFKVVIVEAVTTLCLKFPAKKTALAKFLGDYLKDEGSYEFKRAMVEGMFDLVKSIPETKKDVLTQLCEFIEDCEYPNLTIRVLHLVGTEGPTVDHPTPFIRYIYNRLVLENALVRAAAVTALSKFGVGQKEPELKRSVHVLLSRSLDDEDDEVRDRAALSLRLMDGEDEKSRELVRNDSMYSLAEFEDRLALYVSTDDRSAFNEPFDLSLVPIVSRDKALSESRTKKLLASTTPKPPSASKNPGRKGADDLAPSDAAAQKKYTQQLQAIPEFSGYGKLLKSSPAIELTESGIEYIVTVVKHVYDKHVVLQFNITNDMDNTAFENVDVQFESVSEYLEADWRVPIERLEKDQSGIFYVSFKNTRKYVSGPYEFAGKLSCILKDTQHPDDQGYEDGWGLIPFSLTVGDFFLPAFSGSFDNFWQQPRIRHVGKTWTVPRTSIQEYVEKTLQALQLEPFDGTGTVSSKYVHKLKLYGRTIYGGKVAAMVDIVRQTSTGPIDHMVKVQARSEEIGVATLIKKTMPLYVEKPDEEEGAEAEAEVEEEEEQEMEDE
ncbi:putative coatomer subunit gamma [Phyllosticta citribraziliensis]|uniref:Coatomer subunit gamma n=1 Tax=Phyllosticta citribraziliensis TaxID=989973 RepID=A0ABR1LRY4_9PEZI